MTRHRRYALLLYLIVVTGTAHAQPHAQQARLTRFTVQDGLPHTPIVAITQDHEGFIWVGTSRGLYRHDGYTFSPYRHDPEDPVSLASDDVRGLSVDRQGRLWVSTSAGLDRYDPVTDAFVHRRADPDDPAGLSSDRIQVTLEDRAGMLWVGTRGGGLNKLDPVSGTVTRYRHDPDDAASLSDDEVSVLLEDRQGRLWIGTNGGGLNRYEPDTDSFRRYVHDAADEASLVSNQVTALHEDRQGRLWVGTGPSWVHRMAPDGSGHFTRYYWSVLGVISFIREDASGTLWVGSTNCCAGRFDPKREAFVGDGLPTGLVLTNMRAMHESRDGTLWFGAGEGLMRLDPTPPPVAHIALPVGDAAINAIYEDRSGLLWVVTAEGILQHDRATGRSAWFFDERGATDAGPIQGIADFYKIGSGSIYEDRAGDLWLVWDNVLRKLDGRTGRLTPYRAEPGREGILGAGFLSGLEGDAAGNLWIAVVGSGLNKLDPRTQAVTHYATPRQDLQTLTIARDGTLWLGTAGGFLRFDPGTETFTDYTQPVTTDGRIGYDVHTVYEDPAGRLWYGAPHLSLGIDAFDPRTGSYAHVFSLDQPTHDIQADRQGRIWIQTGDGVVMYDPEEGDLTTFGEGSEVTGWVPSGSFFLDSQASASGELFFAVAGGIKAFYPEHVLAASQAGPPAVVLTDLEVSSQRIRPGAGSPLAASIWEAERIVLEHDQHTFGLRFAALDYRDPSANRYRYRLAPYDETWIEAATDHEAQYVKVPPGTYDFRVQGAGRAGVWNEEGASVRLVILPPWWRTTWAYGLYGLLFIGGIVAADRYQRRRLIAKEREKARARELEQAREIERAYHELREAKDRLVQQEKMASLGALTAGIAHEIKNPLNFVNNFAALSKELAGELEEELDAATDPGEIRAILADLKTNAAKIEEHGRRADAIVKSMMQHARGGTGERRAVDLNALVDEYVELAYHGKRAQTPAFSAEVRKDLGEAVGQVEAVPQDLGRVLLNLIGNAFDAVHERAVALDGTYQPTVTVSTRQVDGQAVLRVSDNGPGIPPAIREKIFEPFFTTKPTGSGTGLGLSMSYDIVTQGHGGTLAVESEEGRGATFIVTLPADPEGTASRV